jgi:hypothetical protein
MNLQRRRSAKANLDVMRTVRTYSSAPPHPVPATTYHHEPGLVPMLPLPDRTAVPNINQTAAWPVLAFCHRMSDLPSPFIGAAISLVEAPRREGPAVAYQADDEVVVRLIAGCSVEIDDQEGLALKGDSARRSLRLRPAHSRCHQFVTR